MYKIVCVWKPVTSHTDGREEGYVLTCESRRGKQFVVNNVLVKVQWYLCFFNEFNVWTVSEWSCYLVF